MKLGQIWSIDLVIALAIFTTGMVLFYLYALNYGEEADTALASLTYDAEHLAAVLLTSGYPANWSNGDVVVVGISDNNQVNETKLAQLASLTTADYARTQALFGTSYNWYLNFSEPLILNGSLVATVGQATSAPRDMIRVQRITVYRNKPTVMNVHVWN